MRISDWSSDVCSSDLLEDREHAELGEHERERGADGLDELEEGISITESPLMKHELQVTDNCPINMHQPSRPLALYATNRSETRRVGKEWVSTCRIRWSQ